MLLLYGHSKEVASWVSLQLGGLDFGASSAIGILKDSALVAGVVYNNYRTTLDGKPLSLEMSVATIDSGWCSRGRLKSFFLYPFVQLKVQRVQATIARRNKKARRFVEKLGFTFEGIARKSYPNGDDAAVYSMLKNECKWI